MKYLIMVLSLFLIGCGDIKAHLNTLPSIAFENIQYNRSGFFSTAIIEAKGARVEDNILYIDHIKIMENFPWLNVNFQMNGYSRQLKK